MRIFVGLIPESYPMFALPQVSLRCIVTHVIERQEPARPVLVDAGAAPALKPLFKIPVEEQSNKERSDRITDAPRRAPD